MQTIIIVLKQRLSVRQLVASSTEKLLFISNSPILLGPHGKKPRKATPRPLGNFLVLDPLLSDISVALRGGGVDIFWNYATRIILFKIITKFCHETKISCHKIAK